MRYALILYNAQTKAEGTLFVGHVLVNLNTNFGLKQVDNEIAGFSLRGV